ncbi:regulatory LuxR family protein [Flavobacteriaceae bacterium MAR_2009_75]|nr:regulatory LuxR family protein [Flavobacteriaceae bacterium MAR_2009_75]
MKVFGSEMHLITFLIIVIELIIIVNFTITSFKEKSNKSTKRFIWFTLTMILYNVFSGLFPDPEYPISLIVQYILAYGIGVFVALYYVYYVYSEFDIKKLRYFTVKHLIVILGSAFIFFFVVPLLIWSDIVIAKSTFIYIPVFVAFAFLYRISFPLIKLYRERKGKSQKFYRNRIITGYLALLSIVLMPVVVAMGDYQVMEQLTVNSGYFLLAIALIQNNIYLAQKRIQFLLKIGYSDEKTDEANLSIIEHFNSLNLSKREIEIANYILEGKSYKEISKSLFIAEGTVSKHASNIFKKAGVEDRPNFVALFRN